MRPNPLPEVEKGRITRGPLASTSDYGNNGAFRLRILTTPMLVIVSDQEGWDHVSASLVSRKRTPTWEEMSALKALFFLETETVMQLHVPVAEHRSLAEALHLWRPQQNNIPQPPAWMVAPGTVEETLQIAKRFGL